ncbi:MAG TPA: methylmalonyl Co-A mutase-associated GTPase MeaB, partial [Planctomycetota bacterium]|nr:methylmalonyl Co-A mutase-associated GTPase MeaB [Planctomycetota bacterium]
MAGASGASAGGAATAVGDLARRVLAGDRKAAARAISIVEDQGAQAGPLLDALYPATGKAYRVGVTGPPGAGKSTLTAALAERLREGGRTVGIVAIDPTSPFTGGALLGDRIRMTKVSTDPGVFIRSMASRGALGGIARTTGEACDVLDASGKETVFIETVGVGQSEVEVAGAADTVCVVVSPEAGDAIQTMKAGLMEIAHVFVVNKCDREGADRMVRAIESMLELAMPADGWIPPVVKTAASSGEGVADLVATLEKHRGFLREKGLLDRKRRDRVRARIRSLFEEKLLI